MRLIKNRAETAGLVVGIDVPALPEVDGDYRALKQVLLRSIDDGGSTLRDHVQPGGELGYFQTRFNVYDRAGAPGPTRDCGKIVKRLVQSGRSTFYCANCQR